MNPTYFKYELVRLIRNKRFFFYRRDTARV